MQLLTGSHGVKSVRTIIGSRKRVMWVSIWTLKWCGRVVWSDSIEILKEMNEITNINAVFCAFILKLFFVCFHIPHLNHNPLWLWCIKHACVCVFCMEACTGLRECVCVCVCLGRRRPSVWIIDEEIGALAKLKGRKPRSQRRGSIKCSGWTPLVGLKLARNSQNKPLQL